MHLKSEAFHLLKALYLLHHMGGIMSDEVLCCIDGTQDIIDLDLRERKNSLI